MWGVEDTSFNGINILQVADVLVGSVIFILNEGETESKLAESAAGFLGRHMEG